MPGSVHDGITRKIKERRNQSGIKRFKERRRQEESEQDREERRQKEGSIKSKIK